MSTWLNQIKNTIMNFFLLQEDGFFLLQEDGDKIVLNQSENWTNQTKN